MMPSMDEGGLNFFKNAASLSKCYLEYGCGGSTIFAANVAQVPAIISVDTDKNWIEKVKSSIESDRPKLYIEHCDFGSVGDWGMPKTREKIDDFWQYPALPWRIAKEEKLTPDTVLIDGRFRVAAFLYTLLAAEVGTTILFDDYLNRPQYHIVEQFCLLSQRHGRMGVFVVTKEFSYTEITKKIMQYSLHPHL